MTAFLDIGQPTLLDALANAQREQAIPVARIVRIRAAVSAFSRLMRRPANELPAHQGFVIRQLRRLRHQPTGLSLKTLSNTRSELLYLVKTVCGPGHRSALPLSQDWKDFRATLGDDPAWWSLSRLAAFSSRDNTTPSDIGEVHLGRFTEALEQSGEVSDPIGHSRRTIRVWNKVTSMYPSLRMAPLTLAPQQWKRWTLPETGFAQSFRADVEAWLNHLTADDPLSPRSFRALRPSTVRMRRHQIFKAASALVLGGRAIETIRKLADLVSVEHFQDILRYLLRRQNGTRSEALHGLAGALLAVARHHVGVDQETEARLARIVKNLDLDAAGFRSKTRTRLKAFENDRCVAALLHLPARLLAEAKIAKSPRRRKQLCEIAIAIEILTFAPLRVSNLVSLQLGVTLRRVARGRERHLLISIPSREVKNSVDLTYELPTHSNCMIEEALGLYHQADGWLFPGRRNCPKPSSLLSNQIKRTVENRLGVPFHTHMFRALAGYLHLRENPNGFEAVRAILGNRDDKVVRQNYSFLAERSLIANAQAAIGKTRARFASPARNK